MSMAGRLDERRAYQVTELRDSISLVGQTSLGVTFGGNLNLLLPWWTEGLRFFPPMQ